MCFNFAMLVWTFAREISFWRAESLILGLRSPLELEREIRGVRLVERASNSNGVVHQYLWATDGIATDPNLRVRVSKSGKVEVEFLTLPAKRVLFLGLLSVLTALPAFFQMAANVAKLHDRGWLTSSLIVPVAILVLALAGYNALVLLSFVGPLLP
jgi:hypothetical protein